MKRRELITLIGGAVLARPLAVRAQHPMPVVGLLHLVPLDRYPNRMAAFRQGLKETGYIEGQNV